MAVPYSSLPEIDRYALHRLAEFISEVKESYEGFQFFRFYQVGGREQAPRHWSRKEPGREARRGGDRKEI